MTMRKSWRRRIPRKRYQMMMHQLALLSGKERELATQEDWIEAGVTFEEDASADNGDDVSERDECDNCESSHVYERDEYDDSSDSSECNGYSESSDERPTR